MGNYDLKGSYTKKINNCFVKSTFFSLRKGPPPRLYNYIDPVINKV